METSSSRTEIIQEINNPSTKAGVHGQSSANVRSALATEGILNIPFKRPSPVDVSSILRCNNKLNDELVVQSQGFLAATETQPVTTQELTMMLHLATEIEKTTGVQCNVSTPQVSMNNANGARGLQLFPDTTTKKLDGADKMHSKEQSEIVADGVENAVQTTSHAMAADNVGANCVGEDVMGVVEDARNMVVDQVDGEEEEANERECVNVEDDVVEVVEESERIIGTDENEKTGSVTCEPINIFEIVEVVTGEAETVITPTPAPTPISSPVPTPEPTPLPIPANVTLGDRTRAEVEVVLEDQQTVANITGHEHADSSDPCGQAADDFDQRKQGECAASEVMGISAVGLRVSEDGDSSSFNNVDEKNTTDWLFTRESSVGSGQSHGAGSSFCQRGVVRMESTPELVQRSTHTTVFPRQITNGPPKTFKDLVCEVSIENMKGKLSTMDTVKRDCEAITVPQQKQRVLVHQSTPVSKPPFATVFATSAESCYPSFELLNNGSGERNVTPQQQQQQQVVEDFISLTDSRSPSNECLNIDEPVAVMRPSSTPVYTPFDKPKVTEESLPVRNVVDRHKKRTITSTQKKNLIEELFTPESNSSRTSYYNSHPRHSVQTYEQVFGRNYATTINNNNDEKTVLHPVRQQQEQHLLPKNTRLIEAVTQNRTAHQPPSKAQPQQQTHGRMQQSVQTQPPVQQYGHDQAELGHAQSSKRVLPTLTTSTMMGHEEDEEGQEMFVTKKKIMPHTAHIRQLNYTSSGQVVGLLANRKMVHDSRQNQRNAMHSASIPAPTSSFFPFSCLLFKPNQNEASMIRQPPLSYHNLPQTNMNSQVRFKPAACHQQQQQMDPNSINIRTAHRVQHRTNHTYKLY